MPQEKLRAIVLRSTKYSEHDRMLTLFSLEKGKLSACAKGAQSAKSRLLAASQPFTVSEFVLTGKRAGYVGSAELIMRFPGIEKDILPLSAASYACQLTELLTEEDAPEEAIFRLVYYTLRELDKSAPESSPLIAAAFALKLMGLSGMAPRLDGCISCGKEKSHYRFDYSEGGLVCTECTDRADLPALSASEASRMRDLLYMNITELGKMPLPAASETRHLVKTVNDYVIYMSGRSARSFDMLLSLL